MYSNRDRRYMEIAKEVSNLSDFHKCKMGCIVVYKKSIICTGHNSEKTHTLQNIYNRQKFNNYNDQVIPKVHAEVAALSKIQYLDINWSQVKIYVYRQKFKSHYGIARPCPACMKFIRDLGIKKIYYSTNESMVYEEIL